MYMSTTQKTSQYRLTSSQRARILERVPFESEKPFFKILMQPSHVDSRRDQLFVPLNFAMKYIKNQGDAVLSGPNGKYWSAEFKMRSLKVKNRGARVCNGWQEFVKGYNLEVGDVCIFELLDGVRITFEVSIVRFAEYECCQWSQASNYASGASKPYKDVTVKIEIE
ncbi:B3 domain-containing protein LOC_Os12g40090-like [Humulus lupulus]|uniref:B3 domain-containing protein LOC_Os12g40090-like n=1 Tax=Humulus lupulus TaxID=3486 RepID=UPI002B4149BA|nr:B3 domain-containing protein LOC_Os12g40090-like [Humulus lupulus]XP_062075725.1 B3 domain-containing protein LOC_Os12g40090-like [Humulus lupulus]